MSIDWERVKPRLAKLPERLRARWMTQAWALCRGAEEDPRSPAEIAEYLGVSVELVEIALAAQPDGHY